MSSPILTRIRALLAKASDAACTPAEAEAFAAKANELLLKHKLTPADLDAGQQPLERESVGADLLDAAQLFGVAGEKLPLWGQSLVNIIAREHFCRLVRMAGTRFCTLYGTPTDREVVRFLCATLVTQARVCSDAHAARFGGGKRARNSFLLGFVTAVSRRLREMRAATEAQGGNYALVTLRAADKLVDDYMAANVTGLRTSSRRAATVNPQAYAAGKAQGERASINRPLSGATARASRLLGA